jgi:hypothetical protein
MLLGLLVLIISLAAHKSNPDEGFAYQVGGAFGAAIIPWAIAFFLSFRRANPVWAIVSGMLFLLIAVVSVSGSWLGKRMEIVDDSAAIKKGMQQLVDAKGDVKSIKLGDGPMSKVMQPYLDSILADRHALESEWNAANADQILLHQGLKKTAPVLSHCGEIGALKTKIASYKTRSAQQLADLIARIDAADMDPAMKDGMKTGLAETSHNSRAAQDRQMDLNAQIADHAASMCSILARRHWVPQGNSLAFSDTTDMAEFNAHVRKVQAMGAEQTRNQQGSLERTSAAVNKM